MSPGALAMGAKAQARGKSGKGQPGRTAHTATSSKERPMCHRSAQAPARTASPMAPGECKQRQRGPMCDTARSAAQRVHLCNSGNDESRSAGKKTTVGGTARKAAPDTPSLVDAEK
eukprot:4993504-Lingulodinium_polyedra.AAC.1